MHWFLLFGITSQMITANAFDRQNPPIHHFAPSRLEDIFSCRQRKVFSHRIGQTIRRTAGGASVRLGMETTVSGILVLFLTRLAHRKSSHRRLRSVIGKILDNRIARPAMGAIDKSVTIPSICRL